MVVNLLQAANRAVSSKQKSTRKLMAEAASGWSNDIEDDDEDRQVGIKMRENLILFGEHYFRDYINPPPIIQRGTRRAAEEIIATGNFD